ncbi:hypothetical protein B0H19DRAFT_1268483 [Mycena capillaripes]|nr:hypothetical protein B0H19DRAFT_1268483 [Mycena capillaripes]
MQTDGVPPQFSTTIFPTFTMRPRAIRRTLFGVDRRLKQARRQVVDDNVADTFQQEVNDLLAIGIAATTSGQAQGSNM